MVAYCRQDPCRRHHTISQHGITSIFDDPDSGPNTKQPHPSFAVSPGLAWLAPLGRARAMAIHGATSARPPSRAMRDARVLSWKTVVLSLTGGSC